MPSSSPLPRRSSVFPMPIDLVAAEGCDHCEGTGLAWEPCHVGDAHEYACDCVQEIPCMNCQELAAGPAGVLTMKPRLLDLYCCEGGAGKGYADAGFEVVGVDIGPQPRYPYEFHQADALKVLRWALETWTDSGAWWHGFDAIHASPPCQRYSATQRLRGNDHPDLIGPTRELLEATGLPYVIENEMDARDELQNPVMLCGAMFPALRVYRHRLFETNWDLRVPEHPPHVARQLKMGRSPKPGEWVQAVGNFAGVAEAREAMQTPWMSRDGMRECIPPAFAEWVGQQLMAVVTANREAAAA